MSANYSTTRLVNTERAKEKYTRLLTELQDIIEDARIAANVEPLTIKDHENATRLFRRGLCAAQELESIAKGNPAPAPR